MTINITWEYFLGIVAVLIGIAWYSGWRFSSLETSMKWVKDSVSRFEDKLKEFEDRLKGFEGKLKEFELRLNKTLK